MNVNAVYFTGTGTTKKVIERIAEKVSHGLNGSDDVSVFDFSLKSTWENELSFGENDIVIIGTPVYAGRIPNVLLKYLNTIQGNGALAVCVMLYGNRNFDDGLIEMRNLLDEKGFHVIAAGAFIGEHSFSTVLAAGRPDASDMAIADKFAEQISEKVKAGGIAEGKIAVKGEEPLRPYYQPKDKEGKAFDFKRIKPKTSDDCIDCKLCAEIRPLESIDYDNTSDVVGICIKCCACVKFCPVNAKFFDDEGYLRHQKELEEQFAERKEPELFI